MLQQMRGSQSSNARAREMNNVFKIENVRHAQRYARGVQLGHLSM